MSSPPEYHSLLQHDPDASIDKKQSTHSYPPTLTLPNAGEGSSNPAGVTTVTYSFVPRWPIKAKAQDALGILYPNREATVEALLRIFPILDEFDQDRIEVLVPVEGSSAPSGGPRWGLIMEDAWPHITGTSAPKSLKVQIKDMPGDERKRDLRTCLIITALIFAVLGFFPTILFIIWLFGGMGK